eukprot:4937656-Pyramimonas_sp.AAC.1
MMVTRPITWMLTLAMTMYDDDAVHGGIDDDIASCGDDGDHDGSLNDLLLAMNDDGGDEEGREDEDEEKWEEREEADDEDEEQVLEDEEGEADK